MSATKRCVYLVYYSTHGHIEKLAREVAKGVEKGGGNLDIIKKSMILLSFK